MAETEVTVGAVESDSFLLSNVEEVGLKSYISKNSTI